MPFANLPSTPARARKRLLESGLGQCVGPFGRRANLATAAAHAEIPLPVAESIFGDEAGFSDALRQQVLDVFYGFVHPQLNGTDPEDGLTKRIRAIALGFLRFAISEPVHMGAYFNVFNTHRLPDSWDCNLGDFGLDPLLKLVLIEIQRDMARHSTIDDEDRRNWVWLTQSLSIYSGMIGMVHLSTFGITRHLSDAAKNQLMRAVVNHVVIATEVTRNEGLELDIKPDGFLPSSPPAVQGGKGPEATYAAIMSSAIACIGQQWVEEVTLDEVLQGTPITRTEAVALLDAEKSLTRQVEEYLDLATAEHMQAMMAELPADSLPVNLTKAVGFAYVETAMDNPVAFDVHIWVSSRSIVPASFDNGDENFEMGASFSMLQDLVRASIALGGGERDSWPLFEQTMNLWMNAHGLAKSFANGPLSQLPIEQRRQLAVPVIGATIGGMVTQLGLHLPGVSDVLVVAERP
ncbi:hypothetical protein [Corynebacterium epidermidicanis]|uniref:hypothetical protein n=1 Tax=Corynebacterium epidermidicanis TaxID=1050174 RepID=UPI001187512A|nr:hypothetical protein [Corynebacterium epidermidicanis]